MVNKDQKSKLVKVLAILCGIMLACVSWTVPALGEGDTRYDTQMNLPFNEKAGNVNPQTGNLTITVTDLELPGRGGLNFQFGRVWNLNQANAFTMYRDPFDGSNKLNSETIEKYNRLGVGWSSNLPYIFTDNSSGTQVINLVFNGSTYELDSSGLALYKSNTNPDKSNILWYDLQDLRVYQESQIKYGDYASFAAVVSEYGITDPAEMWNEYVLILKDNSRYWFRADGKLMMQEDRTGLNRIWYFYDSEGRLKVAVDTAERRIRFGYDTNNNLTSITWDVERGVKYPDGHRERVTETRQITYQYNSAENFTIVNNLKPYVVNYRQPFVLKAVIDPENYVTSYDYQEGPAYFTYDSFKQRSQNVYLLLKEVASLINEQGKYKNKQCFVYEIPAQGMYSKKFYNGYIEYYKISRQYYKDRNGRVMNDTTYQYHDQGEAGNVNQYTAVVQQGNLKTTYTYSLSDDKSRDNVLDKIDTETQDGFREERDFVYNANREKILEEVYRGQFIYRERYDYDLKGNLKWREDKVGLVVAAEYDDKYSLPRYQVKKLEVNGVAKEYETEYVINELGQIEKEIIYLEQPNGSKRSVVTAQYQYDSYGNLIKVTDTQGNSVYTVFDTTHHVFPVKVYQDVTVSSWANGDITGVNWMSEPDGTRLIRVRNWKVYNSDGTLWMEIDNDGYAIEHYYDKKGTEIETVIPDSNDLRSFAQSGTDFDDFLLCPDYNAFLASRNYNPKVRREISYTEDFIKTYTDLDVSKGEVKTTGQQSDGLGHVEEEIEYDGTGSRYAVKRMTYDLLGRMVGLTDPDASPNFYSYPVNGIRVEKHDKTWITEYDDQGRKKWVTYPETEAGQTDTKHFVYNDQENSITITDPTGRKTYERRDWNGNLVEAVAYGDWNTGSEDTQVTNYTYDKLNRLVKLTDPKGIITTNRYDERDLLLEQNFGITSSDTMQYNDLGLLIRKTDRKGQVLVMQYDEMKRNTAVIHYKSDTDYQNNTIARRVDTVYDKRGNAVRISSDVLIEYYVYDHNNRVTKLERRLKDQSLRQQVAAVWGGTQAEQKFGFNYTYNDAGIVTQMTYPDGSIHRYQYDGALGRLQNLDATGGGGATAPFITGLEYTPSGVVNRMTYANGTSQIWNFDNRKRISEIKVTGPGGVLEDLKYKLNGSGDILTINENEYEYDGFDRISIAKTLLPDRVDTKKLVAKYFGTYDGGDPINSLLYLADADLNSDGRINGEDHTLASLMIDDNYDNEIFTYDKNGNRTQLIQNGDIYTYQYGDRNKLEAIYVKKSDDPLTKLYLKFEYDANGNMTTRTLYTVTGEVKTVFEYDTLNRLVKTTENTKITEYLYDNAGNRFIKKGGNGTTLYLRHGQTAVAMDIEIPTADPNIKGKINRYVLSGELLAGRVTKTVNMDGTSAINISYYHLDHLNSTKCVTNPAGEVEVKYIYRAFGEQLTKIGTGEAKYTYTGKQLDDETNLYYFNARFYDATIGRFITEDPAKDGLNWYIFCNNNPLRLIDPNGLSTVNMHEFSYSHEFTPKEEKRFQTGESITCIISTIYNVLGGQTPTVASSKTAEMLGPISKDFSAKANYTITQNTTVTGNIDNKGTLTSMTVNTAWSYYAKDESSYLSGKSRTTLNWGFCKDMNAQGFFYKGSNNELIFAKDEQDLYNKYLRPAYEGANEQYENDNKNSERYENCSYKNP